MPEPFALTDAQDSFKLGPHLEFLEDPTGDLTINDVASPEFSARFVPSDMDVPNFGFTDSAYWVRLPLRNESQLTDRWFLQVDFPNMHYVDLYTPRADGSGFDVKQTGSFQPSSTRDIQHPRIVFDETIALQDEQAYYLRFENGASMTLALTAWTPDAFAEHSKLEYALGGLYFGALLALLAYNLFLLVSLRERSYLYLVMVLASMIVFEAAYSGYSEIYFLPALSFLSHYFLTISFALTFLSMLLFANAFLELKTHLPMFHRLNVALAAVWAVLLLLLPFISYHDFFLLGLSLALISMTIILIDGIVAWRQGIAHTRFFMASWLGLLVAIAVVILVRAGFMPSILITERAYRLAILWMGICWSLALADRVNVLKADVQRNERRLAQILEGLPLGVVMYEKDQKPSYINQRVVEILTNPSRGIEPELSTGQTLAQAMAYYAFRVAGTDQPYPLAEMPISRALQGEPAAADDLEADLIDKRVPLEIWASPVKNAQGEVEGAVVAFQDITRRRNAEAELAVYRDDLELLVEERTAQLSELNDLLNHEVAERKSLAEMQVRLIEWLSAINISHQMLRGTADLPRAYGQLLQAVSQLLDVKSAFMLLCSDRGNEVGEFCCLRYADAPLLVEPVAVTCAPESPLQGVIEEGELLILSADESDPILEQLAPFLQDEQVVSVVLAPIRSEQDVIGLLGLGMATPAESFAREYESLFDRIRFDLARVSEYASLYDTARELAAADERTRLARDLHDSVTQVLFSASLLAEALPQIWQRDPDHAAESLDGLRRLTRGALAEMRTLLLELRPTALLKTSLPELISQMTEGATGRSALSFRLLIEKIPDLPEDVHVGFYRIGQEGLNNVIKHAQAGQVEVRLGVTSLPTAPANPADYGVSLVIADDGVGFAVEDPHLEHMGLGIMRERATAIGADLSIESRPAHGTTVTLIWPAALGSHHD